MDNEAYIVHDAVIQGYILLFIQTEGMFKSFWHYVRS